MLKKIKDFNPLKSKKANKPLIFIIIALVLVIIISLLIMSDNPSEDFVNPLDESTMQNSDNNASENNNTFVPPPMVNNPFLNQELDTNASNLDKKEVIKNNTSAGSDFNITDISDSSTNQEKQEDMVKNIAKTQKPGDMIKFLKELQKDMDFNKQGFKYDYKEYKIGDKFLNFFEITDITPNFVRFKDETYEYNLRFIGE